MSLASRPNSKFSVSAARDWAPAAPAASSMGSSAAAIGNRWFVMARCSGDDRSRLDHELRAAGKEERAPVGADRHLHSRARSADSGTAEPSCVNALPAALLEVSKVSKAAALESIRVGPLAVRAEDEGERRSPAASRAMRNPRHRRSHRSVRCGLRPGPGRARWLSASARCRWRRERCRPRCTRRRSEPLSPTGLPVSTRPASRLPTLQASRRPISSSARSEPSRPLQSGTRGVVVVPAMPLVMRAALSLPTAIFFRKAFAGRVVGAGTAVPGASVTASIGVSAAFDSASSCAPSTDKARSCTSLNGTLSGAPQAPPAYE